jgi:hypothetical protein
MLLDDWSLYAAAANLGQEIIDGHSKVIQMSPIAYIANTCWRPSMPG